MAVSLTNAEARVVAQVLQTITAYSLEELEEHFDWSEQDIERWHNALLKTSRV